MLEVLTARASDEHVLPWRCLIFDQYEFLIHHTRVFGILTTGTRRLHLNTEVLIHSYGMYFGRGESESSAKFDRILNIGAKVQSSVTLNKIY
jgi:hypothetical protein